MAASDRSEPVMCRPLSISWNAESQNYGIGLEKVIIIDIQHWFQVFTT